MASNPRKGREEEERKIGSKKSVHSHAFETKVHDLRKARGEGLMGLAERGDYTPTCCRNDIGKEAKGEPLWLSEAKARWSGGSNRAFKWWGGVRPSTALEAEPRVGGSWDQGGREAFTS